MFTRKTISSMPRRRMYFFRYMTMFFLGASAVILSTQALNIQTSLTNAVQYISQILLTSDGSTSGTTGIVLNGNGIAQFFGATGSYVQILGGGQLSGTDIAGINMNGTNGTASGLALWHSDLGGGLSSFDRNMYIGAGAGYPVTITTGGNVGIGTAAHTPTEQLQVGNYAWIGQHNDVGSTTGGTFLRLYDYSNDVCGQQGCPIQEAAIQLNTYHALSHALSMSDRSNNWKISAKQTGIGFLYATGAFDYSSKMKILNNGNIGIGDETPTYKLSFGTSDDKIGTHIDSSNYGWISPFNDTDNSMTFNLASDKSHFFIFSGADIRLATGGYLQAGSSYSNQLYLANDGNVGIGTNTPDYKLEVAQGFGAKIMYLPDINSPYICFHKNTNEWVYCTPFQSGGLRSMGCYKDIGHNYCY